MNQETKKNRKLLRRKLRKGDQPLIKEKITRKGITLQVIRNFYAGRAVNPKLVPSIIRATKKVLAERNGTPKKKPALQKKAA